MRTTKELKKALNLLAELPDTPERLAQKEVIRQRRTERWVFSHYVINMPEAEKNESVFYAARDAAQYVAGKLEIDVLLGTDAPETDDMPEDDAEVVTVPKGYLDKLEKRIARLEALLLVKNAQEAKYADKEELMQAEVCEYLGCAQCTVMRWTQKGFIKAIQRGRNLYYLKSELDASPVVREYKERGRKP